VGRGLVVTEQAAKAVELMGDGEERLRMDDVEQRQHGGPRYNEIPT
jgi:hypothetical protein